jgi:hypothetical protein
MAALLSMLTCRRVAVDWGRKADYLDHFQLVIFVTCRDLNGREESQLNFWIFLAGGGSRF